MPKPTRGGVRGSGRGVGSGVIRLQKATTEQKRIMENIKNALTKRPESGNLKFTIDKSGVVLYTYTERRIYHKVHASKMASPEKDDIVERTTHHKGYVFKDGLIKEDRPETSETLIRRGRSGKRNGRWV